MPIPDKALSYEQEISQKMYNWKIDCLGGGGGGGGGFEPLWWRLSFIEA